MSVPVRHIVLKHYLLSFYFRLVQGTNPIIIAASKSGPHNEVISNEIRKNSKAKSSAGLGKGWFNFQVIYFLTGIYILK